MKYIKLTLVILATILLQNTSGFAQGISVNSDGSDAHASAAFDVQSTAKGFLMPRMTEEQKNAINLPATGLMIYQTDGETGYYCYNGTSWNKLSEGFLNYSTIEEAEAASAHQEYLCYIVETKTYYRFETSGAAYIDDNQYILSTGDAGNTRWLGVAGRFNINNILFDEIIHLDASSGSATITELNKVYYIEAAATTTTITIPDVTGVNAGWFLHIMKCSGNGIINIQTAGGQNIDGSTPAKLINLKKGLYIKADITEGAQWLKIHDSRSEIPITTTVSSNYGATESWLFDYLLVNTNAGDIDIILPPDISGFPEGAKRMFFNTGSNRVYGFPNGNVIDGSTEARVIAPGGYIELQKIDGVIKIVREKYVTLKKDVDEIANLVCWLDASQLAGSDGSSLATWSDLSGNGHHFTASNQPTLQTLEQNGKNVVRFDGINDVMSAGDVEVHDNTLGLTMIAVVKPTESKKMPILSKYLSSPNHRQFAFGNENNYLFEDLSWSNATDAVLTMGQNDFQIAEMVWTPGLAFELYINGVLQTSGDQGVNDITNGNANLKLGGGDDTRVGFWEGDFAEIMVYSQAVSDTEREMLRANLAVKWDIDEIIIANGGYKYWQRDDETNTIYTDVANDNVNIGTGTFSGNILNASELINAPALSTAPSSPQAGSIYFNTTDSKLKVFTGTVWEDLN